MMNADYRFQLWVPDDFIDRADDAKCREGHHDEVLQLRVRADWEETRPLLYMQIRKKKNSAKCEQE